MLMFRCEWILCKDMQHCSGVDFVSTSQQAPFCPHGKNEVLVYARCVKPMIHKHVCCYSDDG